VAEGGGLLNRYTLQRRIEGSNPSVSASLSAPIILTLDFCLRRRDDSPRRTRGLWVRITSSASASRSNPINLFALMIRPAGMMMSAEIPIVAMQYDYMVWICSRMLGFHDAK
jgi:hypothetical protein